MPPGLADLTLLLKLSETAVAYFIVEGYSDVKCCPEEGLFVSIAVEFVLSSLAALMSPCSFAPASDEGDCSCLRL